MLDFHFVERHPGENGRGNIRRVGPLRKPTFDDRRRHNDEFARFGNKEEKRFADVTEIKSILYLRRTNMTASSDSSLLKPTAAGFVFGLMFLLWLLSGFARSGFAQVGSETDVSWEKRTILSKTLSIRAFFNTGNKDSSINRASGNTFETRLLPTDESYVFFLGSAVKPVLDTEYEILQDRLGVLWARLIVGGGGGYFYGDTYLALVFNYGYLNNEDLYNIANEDNPKYNAVMEGQGLKMILQTDRMSLTMNQREFRGSTDSVKLDAVSHEARFSFKFYDQGNALFLNSAAWRLYHDIQHKNTGEIGLVWRTDNPGWISLFSGLELGLLVLFDFEKTGNEFWNLGLDVNLGDF